MTILRVGLVGLGEVAQSIHLPVLRDQRDRWKIAGVFDLSKKLVDLCLSQNPGSVGFDSAEALITCPDIDVIFGSVLGRDPWPLRPRRDRGAEACDAGKARLPDRARD